MWPRKPKHAEEEENVFAKVEEWCLRHPDPMKRQAIIMTLQMGQHISLLRHRLNTTHHLTATQIDKEVAAEFGDILPWDHWTSALPSIDDPRIVTMTAIISARMHITEMIPALEERAENIESAPMREAIALAFGSLKRLEARSCLEALSADTDPVVSDAATWALMQLPSEDEAQQELVDEFRGFMDGVTASDFVRYGHYHEDDE